MITITVFYLLDGQVRQEEIVFGQVTAEIFADIGNGPCDERLQQLCGNRSREEWEEHFLMKAQQRALLYFKIGIIPKTLEPRQMIPTYNILKVLFPDESVLRNPVALTVHYDRPLD